MPIVLTLPSGTHRVGPILVTLNWEAEPDVVARHIYGGDPDNPTLGYIIKRPVDNRNADGK